MTVSVLYDIKAFSQRSLPSVADSKTYLIFSNIYNENDQNRPLLFACPVKQLIVIEHCPICDHKFSDHGFGGCRYERNNNTAALGWREIRKKEKGIWFGQ
jgi:hypothetical protein